jgi:hypothetical protein
MTAQHALTHADLRSIIVECLRRDRPFDPSSSPFRVQFLWAEVAAIAKARDLKVDSNGNKAWLENRHGPPELHPNLRGPVWSIVWDLIVEGLLRPGDKSEFDLPHIHVTEHGKEAFKGTITLYDPDSYLKALAEKVPSADPIIMKYIAESAETLRRNCLLSSTVTLGCAAEQAFLLLLDAYRDALNPVNKSAFEKAMEKKQFVKQQCNTKSL